MRLPPMLKSLSDWPQTLKPLLGRLQCRMGRHDKEYLPSPPGVYKGIFGPWRCRRCDYEREGFPLVFSGDGDG